MSASIAYRFGEGGYCAGTALPTPAVPLTKAYREPQGTENLTSASGPRP